jgi:transcriptional regulator with XRE-family HTH domain
VSATDLSKLTKLSKSKPYRDAYLSGHVRTAIAYQLQALREMENLSQSAFAAKIGMKQSVVSRLENPKYGKVTIQTLLQIAIALDIALIVRFCSYPRFIKIISDVSPAAFSVDNIHRSVTQLSNPNTVFDKVVRFNPGPVRFLIGHQLPTPTTAPDPPGASITAVLS